MCMRFVQLKDWGIAEDKGYPYLKNINHVIAGDVYTDQGSTLISTSADVSLIINGLNISVTDEDSSNSGYYFMIDADDIAENDLIIFSVGLCFKTFFKNLFTNKFTQATRI